MLSGKGYKFPEIFLSPATSSHISTQDLFFPYMHRLTLSAIYTQAVPGQTTPPTKRFLHNGVFLFQCVVGLEEITY